MYIYIKRKKYKLDDNEKLPLKRTINIFYYLFIFFL